MVPESVDHRGLKDISGLGFGSHSCLRPVALRVVELCLQNRDSTGCCPTSAHECDTLLLRTDTIQFTQTACMLLKVMVTAHQGIDCPRFFHCWMQPMKATAFAQQVLICVVLWVYMCMRLCVHVFVCVWVMSQCCLC